jgi:threonine dehydrogenase-like Zn-dependent dehydrogenase
MPGLLPGLLWILLIFNLVIQLLFWVLVSTLYLQSLVCLSSANVCSGPVGLLCAYSAILRGATRVYSVDKVPARLKKAKSIGAIPINFSEVDPVATILAREPDGVDRVCECVGYESVDSNGKNVKYITLNWAVALARNYGGIGAIGAIVPTDLGKITPFLNIPASRT